MPGRCTGTRTFRDAVMGARERTLSSETLQTEQRPSKGSTHRQGGVGQDSLEARPIQGAYNGERASLTTLGPALPVRAGHCQLGYRSGWFFCLAARQA